eukprot:928832-Prorocentrum_minimum.AAC.1
MRTTNLLTHLNVFYYDWRRRDWGWGQHICCLLGCRWLPWYPSIAHCPRPRARPSRRSRRSSARSDHK